MLNDGYAEHIVKGKTPAGVMAGMVLGAILIVAGVIAFFIPMLTSIGLLVVIIGGVLFGVFISRKETEYEYIMVNEDVDIARIIAKKSRKKMCSFSNNDVKFIAKSDSIYLDNELQQDSSIKTKDYTSKDFAKAARIPVGYAQTLLGILYSLNIVERTGKKGRAYTYRNIL